MRGVPKLDRGRYAIPPHSFPFLPSSSLHPPLAGSYLTVLSACIFASSSSLLPRRSSSSLQCVCKRDRWHLRPQPGFPRIFAGAPRPWFSEFPGSSCLISCIDCLQCIVFHGISPRRTCMCIALCFTLHWFTLLGFALICTVLHCLAFASLAFATNALRCIAPAYGFHGSALHCTAVVLTPFLSLFCIASHRIVCMCHCR